MHKSDKNSANEQKKRYTEANKKLKWMSISASADSNKGFNHARSHVLLYISNIGLK